MGFEVLVQEVMAAITTLPCLSEFFTLGGNVLVHVGIFDADGGGTAAFLFPALRNWSGRSPSELRLRQRWLRGRPSA